MRTHALHTQAPVKTMKSKIYHYRDPQGRLLMTNGRRVSFDKGDRAATSIGSDRDHAADRALWEKQTGTKLTPECIGETEYMDV